MAGPFRAGPRARVRSCRPRRSQPGDAGGGGKPRSEAREEGSARAQAAGLGAPRGPRRGAAPTERAAHRARRGGARGPPGSWRATAGARVRTRGPGSLSKPRSPALATRLAPQEGAASGPASCRRGARLTGRGRFLLVPGPRGAAG